MPGVATRSFALGTQGARAYALLGCLGLAASSGCSLVTSWAGYVGDGGAETGDGQVDAGAPDDGGVLRDSRTPDDAAADSGESTPDASQGDGESDSQALDGPLSDVVEGDTTTATDAADAAGEAGDDGGNGGNDGPSDAPSTSITFVQVTSATPAGSASTASATFAGAAQAGDLIVLVVGWVNGNAAITQIGDSVGNGYSLAVGPTRISAGVSQSIYFAKAIGAAAAGANTVTVTLNAAVTSLDVCAAEYSGLDPVTPLDTTAAFGGRSSIASSGTATTGAARELVFGAGTTAGSFTGPGSTFTLRKLAGTGGLGVVEDRFVSSAGSYSADAPLASSAYYVMQLAAFR